MPTTDSASFDRPSPSTLPLKTIGLLGGMSPESTSDYYRRINEGVRSRLGSFNSARMLIYSANLEEIFDWIYNANHEALGDHLVKAAIALEKAGADFMIMACNTAHCVAPQIEAALGIPFVHIADVLGEHLRAQGHQKLGLLGSRHTTALPFYKERLQQGFGIETLIPSPEDCQEVDRVICDELCFHEFKASSRQRFEQITASLAEQGADSVALACTEIGLLIKENEMAGLPVFDTTALHAERAVEIATGLSSAVSRAA